MVLLYTVGSLGKGSPYEQGAPVGCGMWGVDMKLSEMELRVKHEGRERGGSRWRGQKLFCAWVRLQGYRGYSKSRMHTALGPYGRSVPRSIGPSYGRCVSLILSNPCTEVTRS